MPQTPKFILKDWHTGMAESPVLGFGNMVGVNTTQVPGTVRVQGSPVNKSTSLLARYFVKGASNVYAVGDNGTNGKVFKTADAGETWTEVSGYGTGLIYGANFWKGYLFVFHGAGGTNDVDVFDDNAAWTTGWDDLWSLDSLYHPSLSSTDGKLYIATYHTGVPNQSFISRIAENSGQTFAPGTGATYTKTTNALDLPNGTIVYGLEDYGKDILIMTNVGLFKWDRNSPTFNLPVFRNGSVYAGKTINGLFYFIGIDNSGGVPAVYVTNYSTVTKLKEIPFNNFDYVTYAMAHLVPKQEAITKMGDELLWNTDNGVYSYNTATGALQVYSWSSQGNPAGGYDDSGGLYVNSKNVLFMGSQKSTTRYLDKVSRIAAAELFGSAFIESPLLSLASGLEPETLKRIEVELYQPMTATAGFKLYYRKGTTGSWVEINSITYAKYPSKTNIVFPARISVAAQLQFKIDFDYSHSTNSPVIKEIRIY